MCHDFAENLQDVLDHWRQRHEQALDGGRRVALWGAGANAVTFLSLLGIGTDEIQYLVDINPRRVGRFVPGTGQQIIGPGSLVDYRPTSVFVMNPQYIDEIGGTLTSLGIACPLVPVSEAPIIPVTVVAVAAASLPQPRQRS